MVYAYCFAFQILMISYLTDDNNKSAKPQAPLPNISVCCTTIK